MQAESHKIPEQKISKDQLHREKGNFTDLYNFCIFYMDV